MDNAALYTQPEDILEIHQALYPISPAFSIAAAFGNVHGVYKPGNVKLQPELLAKHQKYAHEHLKSENPLPMYVPPPHSPPLATFVVEADEGEKASWCSMVDRDRPRRRSRLPL